MKISTDNNTNILIVSYRKNCTLPPIFELRSSPKDDKPSPKITFNHFIPKI